jgi:hypothetical protein
MATSDDHDDHEDEDEKDEKDEHEEPVAKKAAPAKAAPAKASSAKAKKVAEDEDEDEEKDEEEDEDEDEEEAPPPKPAAKRARVKARGPGAARAVKASQVAPSGSLGKSVLLFFVIVIGLGAGFAILGRETPAVTEKPKWGVGQTVDVEVTLVKNDRNELGCWAADEIGGKHCAFEAAGKPWSKGTPADLNDDKKLLKPYTTVDRVQFTAAGLWSDPALAVEKLPATRFSVKCKLKVEGTLKQLGVRWEQTGTWYPQNDWYAGSISNCSLVN